MHVKQDKLISFDEFLFSNFFPGELRDGEEITKEVEADKVSTKAKNKKEPGFEETLNKFFPGDYNSPVDINDEMVKKWTTVFDEMKKDIENAQSKSRKEIKEIRKSIDNCKHVSFKLSEKLEQPAGKSHAIEHEISWTIQLAAVSLVVFALSTVFFNANPGLSKTIIHKIGRLSNDSYISFERSISPIGLTQEIETVKSPEIKLSKEELSNYIKENYAKHQPSLSGHSTKADPLHFGRVAGVSEVHDPTVKEKERNIHNLIDEGEKIVFEMLKFILDY